jgi:membrane fusion protein (multidrug efflux system)
MSIKTIIFIFIVVSIALLIFFKIKSNQQTASLNNNKNSGSNAILAEVIVVKDTTINYNVQTIGSVKANEEVNIVSEPAGKITGIFFKEGSTVSKGSLLFKLDDAEYVARKKKLENEIKLATDNEARYNILKTKGGVSQQTYDEVVNTLQSLKADLDLVNVQLSKTEIRAPFNGKLGLRNVSEGAYVSANTILTSLQDVSKAKVDFTIPERYASLIKTGSNISFTVENDSTIYKAEIAATEPAVNAITRSLSVRAITTGAGQNLIPGVSAKIEITLSENSHSIIVPSNALIPKATGYSAYVIKNGKAEFRTLKTGQRFATAVEITHGITAGDSLITTNLLMMRPNAIVKTVRSK